MLSLQKSPKYHPEKSPSILTTKKANSYVEVAVGEGVEERGGEELERFLKNNTMIEKSGNAYWCI